MHTDLIVTVPTWVLLAYLISGVCFILALRGLSGPESSRRGNRLGMIGMALAVGTTLVTHIPVHHRVMPGGIIDNRWPDVGSIGEILAAILIGGGIGLVTARKIQMTAMPQLVAAFHSLVCMAAVLAGAAAYLNPEAFGITFGILHDDGVFFGYPPATPIINPVSRIEMGLGVAI